MGTLLAANSESFRTQLVHHVCTRLTLMDDGIRLDFAKVDSLPRPPVQHELILKLRSPRALNFTSDTINVTPDPPTETEGSHQYTLRLSRIPGRKEAQLNFAALS
jgi:hypothetical protein